MRRHESGLHCTGGRTVLADAILNINKPIGWSSFDVVRMVKKRLAPAKVGHAGTLDPFAEGVLLICTGKNTKQIDALMGHEKAYRGRMRLGIETDTLDIAGKIINRKSVHLPQASEIEEIARSFIGPIEQVPPRYSALHHEGKRFYEMARSGQDAEPQLRQVFIQDLLLHAVSEGSIDFSVVCSKGTYIRSLARDLAYRLGTVAFLSHLQRTRIGEFTINEAVSVVELKHMLDD